MPKIPKSLRRSNPEALAVEEIENHDAARAAAAANAALPIRKPARLTSRPTNEVESGRWATPPSLNSARTAFVRNGNALDTVDPIFLLLIDVTTADEIAALRAAETEVDRLVRLKGEYSHPAIEKRFRGQVSELHTLDKIDADQLAKLNRSRSDQQEVSNHQRGILDSHISAVQASIEGLIRSLLKRGADVLSQEAADYENELTNRAARYGLKPSPSDSLLALRILRDRCEAAAVPGPGTLPAGEWRPSTVLRRIFFDARDVIAVTAENEAMAE